jgi:serine/threonine-protein kinase ATR
MLYHKANATLALVCANFFQNPSQLLAEDEDCSSLRRVLCFALVHLAKASADYGPTSRLVASGLLASAQRLVLENSVVGSGTDIWVGYSCSMDDLPLLTRIQRSVHLLAQVTAIPPSDELNEEVKPGSFVDGLLRQQVQRLALWPKSNEPTDRAPKRRKLNEEPSLLLELAGQLCHLVGADPSNEIDDLESNIMFVSPGYVRPSDN